jgi:hypothetical protein
MAGSLVFFYSQNLKEISFNKSTIPVATLAKVWCPKVVSLVISVEPHQRVVLDAKITEGNNQTMRELKLKYTEIEGAHIFSSQPLDRSSRSN